MPLLKAVVFDLVKTLGEFSHIVTAEEVSRILTERGYEVYPQAWKYAFGYVLFVDYPKEGYKTVEAIVQQTLMRLAMDVDDSTLHDVANLFRRNHFQLYGNSVESLRRVKNLGFKTAVATSTPSLFIVEALNPVDRFIDYLCTGYEAGCEKSNPRMLHHVLEKLGVKPDEAVMVGDDPILDVLNASRVGMKTIQISRSNSVESKANASAKDVLEAVKTVEKWSIKA